MEKTALASTSLEYKLLRVLNVYEKKLTTLHYNENSKTLYILSVHFSKITIAKIMTLVKRYKLDIEISSKINQDITTIKLSYELQKPNYKNT